MTRIGSGSDADVAVPADPTLGVQAVIQGGDAPTIRRADAAAQVRVNGVLLGAEPTPLMHGDKVEIGGIELHYSDDAKSGATQFVSATDIANLVGAKRSGVARPTAASGGRVVSLVDGKEYTVAGSGLVFGRDAACDVVIAQTEVSRRHAEIVPGDQGYQVRDMSANGVFVNGERIQGSHRLARADVVRIGSEEFRFYADVLSPAAAAAASAAAAAAPPAPLVSAPLPPPPPRPSSQVQAKSAEAAASSAKSAAPAEPAPATPKADLARPDPRPVLATLESVNEGPLKGTKFELRGPLSHVGRGAHNDVHLTDESVSESHAKIQRRDDAWYVVDIDSTNGTYVGGTRVNGERRLEGSPDVRFGGMKFRFTAIAASAAEAHEKGTRAIARVTIGPNVHPTLPPIKPTPQSNPSLPVPVQTTESKGGIPAWVWIVLALVVAAVAFFVLKGRA